MNFESDKIQHQIQAELTHLLFKQIRPIVLSSYFGALVIYFFLQDSARQLHLESWLILIIVASSANWIFNILYFKFNQKFSLKAWRNIKLVTVALHGSAWGSLAFFWSPELPLAVQLLLVIPIFVISVIAISSYSANPGTFAAFIIPEIMPLTLILLIQPESAHNGIGFLLMFYPVILYLIAQNYHTAIKSALGTQFENNALLGQLHENVRNLENEIAAHKNTQNELKLLNETLEKRVRVRTNDLQVLYNASAVMSLLDTSIDEVLETIVDILPCWLEYEDACAEIVFEGTTYHSNDYYDGDKYLQSPITINGQAKGHVKVVSRLTLNKNDNLQAFRQEYAVLLDGLARDISANISYRQTIEDQRNMEIQLRHSQKMESVGQLAAGIAHEINTPAQFVSDNLHFIKDSFADFSTLFAQYDKSLSVFVRQSGDASELHTIEQTRKQIDFDYLEKEAPLAIKQSLEGMARIEKIVKAMKEFSHPGTESKSPTDINSAIETTAEVSRNEWKYHATLTTDFDPNLPLVPVLPSEFNQVILNMIVNAAHAIPDNNDTSAGGNIHISTRQENDFAVIAIRDNGTGMSETVRKRIFDPFFTTKEVGKGSGQGLAIAWSVIVDKHQGSIEVESTPGQGSEFSIYLPLSAGNPH